MEHERPAIESDEGEARAHDHARRGAARALAFGLQALAIAVVAVAAAREGLPSSLGTVVLLLVAATLCVNRQALFPSEISVTVWLRMPHSVIDPSSWLNAAPPMTRPRPYGSPDGVVAPSDGYVPVRS